MTIGTKAVQHMAKLRNTLETKINYFLVKTTVVTGLSVGVSAQDLNSVVDRANTLVSSLTTGVIGLAALVGLYMATVGLAKTFGFMEMKPGESKGANVLKIVGGGALTGLIALVQLARTQVVG